MPSRPSHSPNIGLPPSCRGIPMNKPLLTCWIFLTMGYIISIKQWSFMVTYCWCFFSSIVGLWGDPHPYHHLPSSTWCAHLFELHSSTWHCTLIGLCWQVPQWQCQFHTAHSTWHSTAVTQSLVRLRQVAKSKIVSSVSELIMHGDFLDLQSSLRHEDLQQM